MGLDMYLNASRYLSDYHEADKEKKKQLLQIFPELHSYLEEEKNPFREVTVEVCYWRKANAIHGWFVDNVQSGEDDCKKYYVDRNRLEELRDLCKKVLADRTLAADLLPSCSGFFFGNADYDDWYFKDLNHTVASLDKILKLPDGWVFEYQSSW
jgi:hypothetical protein